MFMSNADDWIAEDLANFVTNGILAAAGGRHLVDDDVDNISVLSQDQLRDYTVEKFLFQAPLEERRTALLSSARSAINRSGFPRS